MPSRSLISWKHCKDADPRISSRGAGEPPGAVGFWAVLLSQRGVLMNRKLSVICYQLPGEISVLFRVYILLYSTLGILCQDLYCKIYIPQMSF